MPGRAYLRERAAIARLLREVRPDVVHTHGYRPDVLDAGVARGQGIAVVTTVHGFTGGGWKNRVYEWLQCRAFRRFDAVVAVSRPLVGLLERRGHPVSLVVRVIWFVLVGWWLGFVWVMVSWSPFLLPYPLFDTVASLLSEVPSTMTLAWPEPAAG